MKRTPTPPGAVVNRWVTSALPNEADQRQYAGERAREVVAEAIAGAIRESGLSRAEIARRLGKSARSSITRMLGGQNLTLKSVGELLWACGLELQDIEVSDFGVTFEEPRWPQWKRKRDGICLVQGSSDPANQFLLLSLSTRDSAATGIEKRRETKV